MHGFPKRRILTQDESNIQLSEQDGIRALHLGNSMVQSAMRLAAPNDLELIYTRCMMGFMLFHPNPENILMIGLGGGSLAKFVYHRLPRTKTTVIEINPQIVAMARNYFFVPDDDERLQVIIAEGEGYVASHPASADVLMIDGFDDGCQVSSLCSQDFYNRARETLKKKGVLVVNLLSRDKGLQEYLRRIENSFDGHVIVMTAEARGNLIAFAFKQNPAKPAWEELTERAKKLETEFALPFQEYVKKLRRGKIV
ncbi:polyamine aminopropyltransferase [Nitrosospira sp. Nsp13]|uniref:polyamine aminopropyltransferase n=1 Tax=Nitrosospira sp. Nsp13 TaxID=1855332 RepID=UPI00088E5688|nr:polyamine aminopropyltransferase [Nitrosospira sp. Nsp13]SCY29869.1 spermidine synthase [Nitrosospira sp. Nsp13]